MENGNFSRLYYINNFSYCRDNEIVNKMVLGLIDYVLRTDEFSVNKYISCLKEQYKYDNYMYILECISNYLVKLYNELYYDYVVHKNIENFAVLSRIKSRYDNIMSIYKYNLENSNIVDYSHVYKQTKFKKKKIYTNDLQKRTN